MRQHPTQPTLPVTFSSSLSPARKHHVSCTEISAHCFRFPNADRYFMLFKTEERAFGWVPVALHQAFHSLVERTVALPELPHNRVVGWLPKPAGDSCPSPGVNGGTPRHLTCNQSSAPANHQLVRPSHFLAVPCVVNSLRLLSREIGTDSSAGHGLN
jgi:hypothetical protein